MYDLHFSFALALGSWFIGLSWHLGVLPSPVPTLHGLFRSRALLGDPAADRRRRQRSLAVPALNLNGLEDDLLHLVTIIGSIVVIYSLCPSSPTIPMLSANRFALSKVCSFEHIPRAVQCVRVQMNHHLQQSQHSNSLQEFLQRTTIIGGTTEKAVGTPKQSENNWNIAWNKHSRSSGPEPVLLHRWAD